MVVGWGVESNLVPEKDKRQCFDLMNHRFASVICVSCPFIMRYMYSSVLTITCPEVNPSKTQVERTSTDTYRIPIGCLTHENRTNRILTHKKRASTEHLYPVVSVRSFEHVENLPTDKTGQNGYNLTRNAFTARGTDKKRM